MSQLSNPKAGAGRKRSSIHQFKVTLRGARPPVWRRIQVPSTYSFWALHVAVQDAMGWLDYHLHVFRATDPAIDSRVEIGIPDDEGFERAPEFLPGWEIPIAKYFCDPGDRAEYEYDFGDGWGHDIVLEEVLDTVRGDKYPKCLSGARACPPEDCGGVPGYEQLLKTLANPAHKEHARLLEWLGGSFDAERFDPAKVRFSDPKKRWKIAFGGR